MTQREKTPRKRRSGSLSKSSKLFISSSFFALLALMYLSTVGGFIKGIRTYFWTAAEGVITSSELRSRTKSGSGTVGYKVEIDGVLREASSDVFKRFSRGDFDQKYEGWAARYAVGGQATIYYNDSGEMSLGHWPNSYSWSFGLSGAITLLAAIVLLFRAVRIAWVESTAQTAE